MLQNVVEAIESSLEVFKVRPPMMGHEWADKYFYLSPESSGIEGRWVTLPYQRALINWMVDDDIEEVDLIKSARVGYTKCLIIAMGYLIEQKRRNIAVWQPTDGDAQDFCTDEVDTMLRDVPAVGELLKCAVGAKSKHNTNKKKAFHGSTLDIKGGKSGRNYRRMTKDAAFYDETDGFDADVDGEGSPFELGDTRIQTSPFPKSVRGSTPRVKNASLIEAAVNAVGRTYYRFVPCPACGVLQRLEFQHLRWDGDPANTVYVCPHCSVAHDYSALPTMDAAGRWQSLDGYYYLDDSDTFHGPDGLEVERPKKVAAHIWAAYSYFTPWADTAAKWVEATREAEQGNNQKLKTVVNTRLGETFEERGESIDAEGFADRTEAYSPDTGIPNNVLVITVGADVQGGKNPRIELEFVGHGLENETWSLDYVVLPGDPEQPHVWDQLEEELKRVFTRRDGITLKVAGAFIDSGYLATEVYKFTGPRRRRNVYATKGVLTGTMCNKGTWQGDKKHKAILHTVNVDEGKTMVFHRLQKITQPGPGYCHFPDFYDQDHFEKMTNEEKREKRRAGRLLGHEWVKLGPNEPLDCRVYALGALFRINPNLKAIKARLIKQAERLQERAGEEAAPVAPEMAEEEPKTKKAKRRKRKGAGFVNGW